MADGFLFSLMLAALGGLEFSIAMCCRWCRAVMFCRWHGL